MSKQQIFSIVFFLDRQAAVNDVIFIFKPAQNFLAIRFCFWLKSGNRD